MATPFDEQDLLGKIVEGDRKAFSILYQQYLGELYRYIYLFTKCRSQSEEIVQDVFVKIWEKRAQLGHVTSVKSYLYKSAKNLLLDEIRKEAVKAKAHHLLKPVSEESMVQTDERIMAYQFHQIANEAISLLPEKRRAIFLLRTKEELSLDEISLKLSISKSVVKKQLYAGISFVRNYMHKNEITTFILLSLFLNRF